MVHVCKPHCVTPCVTDSPQKHRITLSIWCVPKMDVNKTIVHLIQLQRKPEPKEVEITYGKKVKDSSCRVKTAKEEWKEREASTTQTVPTRIKIFEGGSVKILLIIILLIYLTELYHGVDGWLILTVERIQCHFMCLFIRDKITFPFQVQVQWGLCVRQRSRSGEIHLWGVWHSL